LRKNSASGGRVGWKDFRVEIYVFQNEIDPVVTHFYDAVLLYANIVMSMSAQGLNYSSGLAFTNAVANYTFLSPASGSVIFNKDSDRLLDYELKAFNEHTGKHDVSLSEFLTRL
jgi:hypothetical protein